MRIENWKLTILISAMTLVALIALACSSAPEPAPAEPAAPAAPVAPGAPAAPTAPAAPAAPAPSTDITPRGTITAAVSTVDVGSGYPIDCLWCASITVVGVHESLFQVTRTSSGGLDVAPNLAASWDTAPDLSYTDLHLQEDVEFHKGWGPMTAEDVAWTFNALNTKTTPEARHDSGGEVILATDKVEAIDTFTARFNWAALGATTFVQLFADAGEGIGTFSKKSFDDMGGEWMRTNIIGTGPFEMDEWTQQKGIFVSAVPDHWRKTPYVDRFIYLEIPEASTRRAMLETGEAEIASIEVKDWPALLGAEIAKAPEGSKLAHAFPFGGNYWENVDPDGNPVTRIRDTSRAWIGDPYELGDDTFNPDTPSMQKALKVRTALMMAIDRDTINEVLLSGLAEPAYINVLSVTDPMWEANKDKWTIEYDPDKAGEMLKEAGYEDGFKIFWWAGLNNADIEISEAIAADWLARYNIESEHDRRTYTTIRPSMVQREFPVLRMHGCCTTPVEWPHEWQWSTLGINSYNRGLEVPLATRIQVAKIESKDAAELTQLSQEMVQYMFDWQLEAGVAELTIAPLYRTDTIADWKMNPSTNNRLGGIKQPEWVRPK